MICEAGTRRVATARTLMPWEASASFSERRNPSATASSACSEPSGSENVVDIPRTTSGAPFTQIRTSPFGELGSARWNVAMNLVTESNGTSARRGRSARSVGASSPAFAAITTSAASVGSPMIPGPSVAPGTRTASEQSAAGSNAPVENSAATTRPPEEVMFPSVPYPPPLTNQASPPRNASPAVI